MGYRFPSFLSQADPATLIVYGLVTEPARVLAELEQWADNMPPLTDRYALLAPHMDALRLSSSGWIDIPFEQRITLTNSGDLFQYCRSRILRNVSQFAKPTRQLIDSYLDFVCARTESCKDELEEFGPSGEVYGAEDWVFSAWLPLPHARILLPPEFQRDPPQFAEVDIAFWHNGRVTAALIENASTPIKSKQRRLDFLCENHPLLDVVSIPRDRIADGRFPADLFPDTFGRYWEGLTLPTGPAPPII